ncbi:MAG: lysylphosphatidylglycerol synthase transmembrane domain-containing protein [Candidatus Rokuibacteriota bacterium]
MSAPGDSSPPTASSGRARRVGRILLGLVVSAALLVYLFRDVDFHDMALRLAETRWSLLAASMALNLAGLWARSRRWYYLYPPGAHPRHLLNAVVIGYTGNNLLPLRAGEVLRAYVMTRRGQRLWTTVGTIVVERALDGLAVGLILAYLLLAVRLPRELRWAAMVFVSIDVALIAVLAVMAAAPEWCRRLLLAVVRRTVARLARRVSDTLDTFNEGLRGVRTPGHLAPIVVWSTVNWLLWALAAWCALHAAHLYLPLAASWAVLGFVGLGVSLPSSPGFVGIIQAATVLALSLFDVPRAEALTFSITFHASQFVPVTLWGLVLLLVEGVNLSEASRPASAPPVA